MHNLRIKIATFALALGLGGLGGYAMSQSKNSQDSNGVLAEGTKVVRRTIHAKKPKPKPMAVQKARAAASRQALASEPVSTGSSGSTSSGSSSSGRPVQHRQQRIVEPLRRQQPQAGQHRQQRLVGRRLQPATRLDRIERRRRRRRRGRQRRRREGGRGRLSASRQTLPKP